MKLENLKTKQLGKNAIYYNEIDSTQSEIWRLIKNNSAQSGTLVMADIQTNGKGTHGRVWHTDEANNIAFSFFMHLNCNVQKLDGITTKIAEIILEIFREKYKINLNIKMPNDIVFKDKKIGGILTETKVTNGTAKYLVVGIGINTQKETFTEDIKDIATSIKKEFNVNVNVREFIVEFCNRFEEEIIKISDI